MSKVVGVSKTLGADGKVRHHVTVQTESGSKAQIEVGEKEAKGFEATLNEQQGQQPRLLTETMP